MHSRCPAGRKLLYILTFPLFMLTYLPATVAAIVCRPGWKPIEHKQTLSGLIGNTEEI